MTAREDLTLTAYALHLGFTLDKPPPPGQWSLGIPKDTLRFRLGRYVVFQVELGWRVATEITEIAGYTVYLAPTLADFHTRLRPILELAADRHRREN